jgi:hypothetical protein
MKKLLLTVVMFSGIAWGQHRHDRPTEIESDGWVTACCQETSVQFSISYLTPSETDPPIPAVGDVRLFRDKSGAVCLLWSSGRKRCERSVPDEIDELKAAVDALKKRVEELEKRAAAQGGTE